jgi:hypothetical protein
MVNTETLDTGDYVSIAVYFVLVMAVGMWVRKTTTTNKQNQNNIICVVHHFSSLLQFLSFCHVMCVCVRARARVCVCVIVMSHLCVAAWLVRIPHWSVTIIYQMLLNQQLGSLVSV